MQARGGVARREISETSPRDSGNRNHRIRPRCLELCSD